MYQLPEGVAASGALWVLEQQEGVAVDVQAAAAEGAVQLVRWRLPLFEGAGQKILLCRAVEALVLLRKRDGCRERAGAARELGAALGLLATLCSRDPPSALELLHLELPTAELERGQRAPDLLTVVLQAMEVLSHLADPLIDAIGERAGNPWDSLRASPAECLIGHPPHDESSSGAHKLHLSRVLPLYPAGHCMTICAALAESIPGRVALELRALVCQGPPAAVATAAADDLPMLSGVLVAEGRAGRYPATLALLQLLTTLVSGELRSGEQASLLAVWVLRSQAARSPSHLPLSPN